MSPIMPFPDSPISLPDEAATIACGERLAHQLRTSEVLALTGGLGAGKTHLTKGIVHGLGSNANVSSPTFSLVHEYLGGRLSVFHFDWYRLEGEDELLGIGWQDYLDADGVCIVEWADRFPAALPRGTRWLALETLHEGGRSLRAIPSPEGAL